MLRSAEAVEAVDEAAERAADEAHSKNDIFDRNKNWFETNKLLI